MGFFLKAGLFFPCSVLGSVVGSDPIGFWALLEKTSGPGLLFGMFLFSGTGTGRGCGAVWSPAFLPATGRVGGYGFIESFCSLWTTAGREAGRVMCSCLDRDRLGTGLANTTFGGKIVFPIFVTKAALGAGRGNGRWDDCKLI